MKLRESRPNNGHDRLTGGLIEPLWTVEDVAEYVRLKPETVRMMARAHKLPGIKVGKVWRFKAAEIKELFKDRVVQEPPC